MAKKWVVEEALKLDIRKKHLSKDLESIKEKLSIRHKGRSKIKFSFNVYNHYFQKNYPIDNEIYLVQEDCKFGGFRNWLICPSCMGRKMVLYWIPAMDNFYCRKCSNLTYESSQQSTKNPLIKSFMMMDKYKEKLKKKYLHKKKKEKYERILDKCLSFFRNTGFI